MLRDPVALLTPAEQACLRLVPLRESKEIARVLNLAPSTVDNHIASAMQKLGVSSRRVAARLLIEGDPNKVPDFAVAPGQSLPGASSIMSGYRLSGEQEAPAAIEEPTGPGTSYQALREERATFLPADLADPSDFFFNRGVRRNTFGPARRLENIGRFAMSIVTFTSALLFLFFLLPRVMRWDALIF